MKLSDRKPWANKKDDIYCAKLFRRYTAQLRKHPHCLPELLDKLPDNFNLHKSFLISKLISIKGDK